jgi:hypothetical protein
LSYEGAQARDTDVVSTDVTTTRDGAEGDRVSGRHQCRPALAREVIDRAPTSTAMMIAGILRLAANTALRSSRALDFLAGWSEG